MDILKLLTTINLLYTATRGVGHTQAIRFGSDRTPCTIVVATRDAAFTDYPSNANTVLLSDIERQQIPGNVALVLDHQAVTMVMARAASEIADLRNRLRAIHGSIPEKLKS